jgi:adenylate cyclase
MLAGGNDGVDQPSQAQSLPSAEEVRAQLERIVASPDLVLPARARKFLRYIVEETLAGRADRIKAYSVGVEVFERDPSFDAQSDPVVRIEAGRLRRALEHYYMVAGFADPVIIDVPKGAYVPHFALRAVNAADPPSAATPLPAPLLARKMTRTGSGSIPGLARPKRSSAPSKPLGVQPGSIPRTLGRFRR